MITDEGMLTGQVPTKEQPPASAAKGAKMTNANAVLGKQTEVLPDAFAARHACSALIRSGSLLTSAALAVAWILK